MIASLGGATAVLIVAEPTVSGRHDMERVAELAAFFKVPGMLCVNKFDLDPEQGRSIEAFARERDIQVMGRIPFEPVFTKAMVQGKTVFEYDGLCNGASAVREIWKNLAKAMEN